MREHSAPRVPTVVVLQQLDEAAISELSAHVRVHEGDFATLEHHSDVEAVITRDATVDSRAIRTMPHLKVIVRAGVGTDNIDVEFARSVGVLVKNTPDVNFRSVAEHTIALLLCVAKDVLRGDGLLRAGEYEGRTSLSPIELFGKTLGLIGFGRIGSTVAQIASHGLGMKVVVWSRTPSTVEAAGYETAESLDALLAAADVVSVHVPLTQDTSGLIGEREFARMKRSAYFINTSRAGVVERGSLERAVDLGHVAGAAVDVMDDFAAFVDRPGAARDGLSATPHSAALSAEAFARAGREAVEVVLRTLLGLPDGARTSPAGGEGQ